MAWSGRRSLVCVCTSVAVSSGSGSDAGTLGWAFISAKLLAVGRRDGALSSQCDTTNTVMSAPTQTLKRLCIATTNRSQIASRAHPRRWTLEGGFVVTPGKSSSPTDAELLVLIASGDVGAVGELYDRYSPSLYPVALKIVR